MNSTLVELAASFGWSESALRSELEERAENLRICGSEASPEALLVTRIGPGELHVLGLGVRSERRRRGIGRRLIEDAVRRARLAGCTSLQLEVRSKNHIAIAFYERLGFRVVGRRPRYYRDDGDDALLMTHEPGLEAPPIRAEAIVVRNDALGGENHRLVISTDKWPGSRPGQFAMLSPGPLGEAERWDPLLPRPMAIYREAPGSGSGPEIEVLYKATGRGTRLLAGAAPGDRIQLVGPLGRGFEIVGGPGDALLVGGGTGTASLYLLAEALRDAGRRVRVQLGARSAADLMGVDDFRGLGVEVELATEDGSVGTHGRVTAVLEAALDDPETKNPIVFACGPTPMMEACANIAERFAVPCQVSLENGMACGFGVCLGCAAPVTRGGYALVCREGPVFDAASVSWEKLP